MNTKQLVALWYTGIALAVTLILFAADNVAQPLWLYLAAIVITGALFIYTFRPHPDANLRAVAAFVVALALILAGAWFTVDSLEEEEVQSEPPIDPNQVEVFDAQIRTGYSGFDVSGRIMNNAARPVSSLTLLVTIRQDDKAVDSDEVYIDFIDEIPPSSAKSFEESIYIDPPDDWTWSYRVLKVWAED